MSPLTPKATPFTSYSGRGRLASSKSISLLNYSISMLLAVVSIVKSNVSYTVALTVVSTFIWHSSEVHLAINSSALLSVKFANTNIS